MRELSNRERKLRNRIILILFMLPFISLISASAHLNDLAKVRAKGQLVMLTLPGPTTYFEDGHGKMALSTCWPKHLPTVLGLSWWSKPNLLCVVFCTL
jgi:hypothetical protein